MSMEFDKLFGDAFFGAFICSKSLYSRVLGYIIKNKNYYNEIYFRYSDLAGYFECHRDTIGDIIRDMLAIDFLRVVGPNMYMVNPRHICQGNHSWNEKLFERFEEIRYRNSNITNDKNKTNKNTTTNNDNETTSDNTTNT